MGFINQSIGNMYLKTQ